MTRSKAARVAVLSLLTVTTMATPLFAQAAIGEPGAFAFYHPNADVLNAGRPSPDPTENALASVPFSTSRSDACARRYRSYDEGSRTFLGHDGYRHSCQ
ncbi:BA14K family protein [Bradyrhizobium sp.]|uniref:BA14K family protein n=1 Tax=Bradyrhizobium sp. TaxID=376 RepID=UPI003C438766